MGGKKQLNVEIFLKTDIIRGHTFNQRSQMLILKSRNDWKFAAVIFQLKICIWTAD